MSNYRVIATQFCEAYLLVSKKTDLENTPVDKLMGRVLDLGQEMLFDPIQIVRILKHGYWSTAELPDDELDFYLARAKARD